jgi:hypothetical protein
MISPNPKSRQLLRQEERKKNKSAKQLEKAEMQIATKIKNLLNEVISADQLDEIAKKTKFIDRKRKICAFAIVSILLMGCFNGTEDISTLETICCYLHKWFKIRMKPQSLQEKINSQECVNFIKEVTIKVMMHEANKVLAKLLKKSHSNCGLFQRILLQDSTIISLPETISKIFRGFGGSASKAAVKCDLILDQSNHIILSCRCLAGRIPDASLSSDILKFSKKDDLVLRDLGYFNLSCFKTLKMKGVKFISRVKPSLNIYLNKHSENPVDIDKHLKSLGVSLKKKIDIDVCIGRKERIHVRLIGIKVPKEVIEARKEQYKKARGGKPSEKLLIFYGYTLMITNISREKMALKKIEKMYKVRWQIELFFKNMKSQLKVDNFTGKNKFRILCILYSKLALTWIAALLYALAQVIVGNEYIISQFKFTRWLHNLGDWQKTVAGGDFTELIEGFERDKHLLKKQIKRTTKKTSSGNHFKNSKNEKVA